MPDRLLAASPVRRGVAALAACALLPVLAACGGGDDGGGSGGDAAPKDAQVSGSVPDVGSPVAERSLVRGGSTYRLEVYRLQRGDGGVVTANVRLDFAEIANPSELEQVLAPDAAFETAMRIPSGIDLVDTHGGVLYKPAKADDKSVCGPEFPNSAETGDQLYVSCVYAGVDDSVTSVDLRAGEFGTFHDVPVD